MPVYLDHNATTPLDPRVREAMLPYLGEICGNPASVHRFGRATRMAVDQAREQVAALVGAASGQVVFTGCGTEANNLALLGAAARLPPGPVAVSRIEHPSVLEPARRLAAAGRELLWLEVDAAGRVRPESLDAALARGARLVSVMLANNETGVIQDVAALAARARAAGAVVHTDAVQAAGKIAVDFRALGVHLLTLSAHKLHGPQGVGALVRDRAVELEPQLVGGGQEGGLRSGTLNVAGIVGFGAAAALAAEELETRTARMRTLRERLERGLAALPGVALIAAEAERLPNTVMAAVRGVEAETLLMALDRAGYAVSSGSACHTGKTEPSHVLTAMGVPAGLALGSIRVSLGKDSTEADVDGFLAALGAALQSLTSGAVGA